MERKGFKNALHFDKESRRLGHYRGMKLTSEIVEKTNEYIAMCKATLAEHIKAHGKIKLMGRDYFFRDSQTNTVITPIEMILGEGDGEVWFKCLDKGRLIAYNWEGIAGADLIRIVDECLEGEFNKQNRKEEKNYEK
jgi:hypothetical protein